MPEDKRKMIDSGRIIVNEEALSEGFTPDTIMHRQGQIKEIAKQLAPSLTNRSVNSILISGQPGSGKTR